MAKNSTPSPSAPYSVSAVQSNIKALLEKHDSIEAGRLPPMYKKAYGVPLDHKRLGFSKLKKLLDASPGIKISTNKHGGVMMLTGLSSSPKKVDDPSPSNSSSKLATKSSEENETASSTFKENESTITDEETDEDESSAGFVPFLEHATKGQGVENGKGPDTVVAPTDDGNFPLLLEKAEGRDNGTLSIANFDGARSFAEKALIGYRQHDDDAMEPIYLNTHIPFCAVAVGVQGAGKSHTMGCLLESCLLSHPTLDQNETLSLHKPMTTLVLHYDQSPTSVCEAAGLLSASNKVGYDCSLDKSNAVILVSPTYYRQRKAFYGDYCTVRPLLFQWSSLTADHVKRIMRITSEDNQLYVASFMTLLRGYQRKNVVPNFDDFVAEIKEACSIKGQSGPLDQRIALLESIIAESKVNQDIVQESMDLSKATSSGMKLIIADLTDPLLSKDEANSLFQVITEQFRTVPTKGGGGKLLALDEAHKFMDGVKSDGLSEAIINVARLMRHDGIRLAVSTQSPKALAPELLELVSVAFLHHFHSQDWWDYIRQKLPLERDCFAKDVLHLSRGCALVFASRHNFSTTTTTTTTTTGNENQTNAGGALKVWIRTRLTADFGASRTNQ